MKKGTKVHHCPIIFWVRIHLQCLKLETLGSDQFIPLKHYMIIEFVNSLTQILTNSLKEYYLGENWSNLTCLCLYPIQINIRILPFVRICSK